MVINKTRLPQSGVTLLEMLITVVIIGILVATAVPSYTNRVKQANRTEATTSLIALAAAQEKFYLRNSQYSASINDLGKAVSLEEKYSLTVAIDVPVAGGFEVRATPLSTLQTQDSDCQIFILDHTGKRTAYKVGGTQETTDICW